MANEYFEILKKIFYAITALVILAMFSFGLGLMWERFFDVELWIGSVISAAALALVFGGPLGWVSWKAKVPKSSNGGHGVIIDE